MRDTWLDDEDVDEEDYGLAERQQTAIDSIQSAWKDSLDMGVEPDILINTSLFAAISQIVQLMGEDAAADYCAKLPDRVRNGEFTLFRVLN